MTPTFISPQVPPHLTLPVAGAAPAGPIAPHVHVRERPVAAAGRIDPHAAGQRRIPGLDPLRRPRDHLGVGGIDPAVAVQVVHHAVAVVVHEDVGGVAVHVPAEAGPPGRVAAAVVVDGGAKTAHDLHAL